MRKNASQKGFTLIELMVVMSILAILAAVALPNYMFIKEKAVLGKSIREGAKVLDSLEIYYNEVGSFEGLNLPDPEGGVVMGPDGFSGIIIPKSAGVTWGVTPLAKDSACIEVCDTTYIFGVPVWSHCHTEYTTVSFDVATGVEIGFDRAIFTDLADTYGFNVGEVPAGALLDP